MSLLTQLLKPQDSKVISNPKNFARTVIGASNLKMRWTSLEASASANTFFDWTTNYGVDGAIQHQVSALDTWETLADITSTGGGYLHWIVLPSSASDDNNTVSCRVTVDGVAYTVDFLNTNSITDQRMILGDLTPHRLYASSSDAFSADKIGGSSSTLYYPSSNISAPSGENQVYAQAQMTLPTPFELYDRTKLRFNNAIKVELKITNVLHPGTAHRRGMAYFTYNF